MAIAAVGAALYNLYAFQHWGEAVAYFRTDTRSMGLLAGCALALAVRGWPESVVVSDRAKHVLRVGALVAFGLFWFICIFCSAQTGTAASLMYSGATLSSVVLVACRGLGIRELLGTPPVETRTGLGGRPLLRHLPVSLPFGVGLRASTRLSWWRAQRGRDRVHPHYIALGGGIPSMGRNTLPQIEGARCRSTHADASNSGDYHVSPALRDLTDDHLARP